MKKGQIKSSLMLVLTSVIWGIAFVAQSDGMNFVGPFTFNAVRNIIGGLVLIPCIYIIKLFNRKSASDAVSDFEAESGKNLKTLLIGGVCCGVALFAASSLQQIGIQYTTVGKAGFITAFYIVLVPVLGIFMKKKCSPFIWLAVALALAGLYLLCIKESFTVSVGDIYLFGCALLFSCQIMLVDYFAPKVDGVKLSMIQFFVCGILSAIAMFIFEAPDISGILSAKWSILYAGVMSCGVAYTLQIIAQKNLNPTVASLIMSLESCVSVLAGWLLLNQRLSVREFIGCGVMFAAIIIATLKGQEKMPEEAL